MLPADEGFDSDYFAGDQVGDGLVVQPQLLGVGGAGEVGFEGGAVDHAVVDVGVVELGPVFAAAFGHVHGEVGAAQQFGGVAGVRSPLGDADAHRHDEGGRADGEWFAQAVQDPVGDCDGRGAVVVFGDENGELVAAESGDEVLHTYAGTEPGRKLDEQRIPAFVAEGVVDVLEIVDVDEQNAFLPGAPLAPSVEGSGQPIGQRRPVRQTGQRVVGGAAGEGLVAVVQGVGHAVEGMGQFAEFVPAGHRQAVPVLAGLQSQNTFVHRGNR